MSNQPECECVLEDACECASVPVNDCARLSSDQIKFRNSSVWLSYLMTQTPEKTPSGRLPRTLAIGPYRVGVPLNIHHCLHVRCF